MRQGTAYEFSAIRNYPHAEIRHLPGKRVSSVDVYYCGRLVAQKTTVFCRGKETSVEYMVDAEMLAKATKAAA